MIVNVQFKDKFTGGYSEAKYSYFTELDAEVGRLVKAPTAYGENIAKIVEIDVPVASVNKYVLNHLKTIEEFAEDEADG